MSTSIIDRVRAADPERHARRLAPAGAVLCLGGAALGNAFGVALALAGLTLLLVSCLSRDDGLLVFGPFARYELHRLAHHRRPPAFWRAAYAGAIFLILIGNVWTYIPHTLGLRAQLYPEDARRMEYVGRQVFNWIAALQFLYLAYFTVQLLAPLVAEEREAKRLDFLLVTDLRNREILIGKAVGRAPQLLDPILASLPVLAVLPLLGGVPPAFVLGAAAATLATVLGLAGLSFFCSIISPTGRKAVEAVYGLCLAYLIVSGLLWCTALYPPAWTFPTSVGLNFPVEVGDVVTVVSAGNPLVGMTRIAEDIRGGADTETRILEGVRWYALFQMAVLAVFGLMAVARLRAVRVANPVAKSPAAPTPGGKPAAPFVRPPVTDDSVAWHERYRETKSRTQPDPRSDARWLFGGGIVVVVLAHVFAWVLPRSDPELPKVVVGVMVWGMGLVALLMASGRAAATVAREREKDTLEGLMLTGLGCREIVRQKWVGCVSALRGLYLVLLGTMTGGVLAGVFHPLSLVLIAAAVPVHAAFAASLGLVFSVRAKTPARAGWTMWLAGLGVVWAASIPIGGVFQALKTPEPVRVAVIVALVPPGATGAMMVAFEEKAQHPDRHGEFVALLAASVAGTVLYAGVARWLFGVAVRRFGHDWEGRR